MADLVGAVPHGTVFGRSMTQLTFDSRGRWPSSRSATDEVVVTRLDHDANIRPLLRMAELAGASVRWAPFDPDTGELPVEAVTDLLGDHTRIVAQPRWSHESGKTRPKPVACSWRATPDVYR